MHGSLCALAATLTLFTAPLLELGAAPAETGPSATRQGEGKDKKKGLTVGSLVRRDLALPLLDGPEEPHRIFGPEEELTTPVVVLAWWSLRDPLCRKAEPKLHKLAADYRTKGVHFYLVESNHDELVAGIGDPLKKIRKLREDAKHTLPLLLDRGNKVADEFAALCANQVFVIDEHRVIRYHGSIDNDPDGKRAGQGVVEHLRDAIDHALEGKSPKENHRRAKGRPIKRAPKETPAPGAKAKKR